jgi:MazG family protein
MKNDPQQKTLPELLAIMARLRDPAGGCPWDIEQDFHSISPHTIEEAYEVADAIRREDYGELCEELGDLLLQVVYHSQIAAELGLFTFDDVADGIARKMIARHPHVFGSREAQSAEDVNEIWEEGKALERNSKNNPGNEHSANDDPASALEGIALALPALVRAQKISRRAARTGFDWPGPEEVLNKIEEELAELSEAMNEKDSKHIREEFGDLLFAIVNLGRKLGHDAEETLRESNHKFERRFRAMEKSAKEQGKQFDTLSLAQMERLWVQGKRKKK